MITNDNFGAGVVTVPATVYAPTRLYLPSSTSPNYLMPTLVYRGKVFQRSPAVKGFGYGYSS